MKLQLPDSVSSLEDLKALTTEVRDYARWFNDASIRKRAHAKHKVESPEISPGASQLLHAWQEKQPLNRDSLDKLITYLKEMETTPHTVTITLAAPAPPGLKKMLTAWCRENVSSNALVTFEFSSILLGGLVVRYGSHIFDWSFRRQILAASGKFPEVLRRV
ncbi:MAG TPA: hypothetical protein VLG13_01965 [Patescibacteria group bacterium]|nr:hypothetical protein [Patescibacteria group bacterium]